MSVTTSTPFKQTPITRALANLNWVPLEYPQNLEAAIFRAFVASQRNGILTARPIRQSQVQEVMEETQLIEAAMQLQTNEYAQWKMLPKPPDPLLPDVSCSPRLKTSQRGCHFWTDLKPKTHIWSFVWICSLLPGRAKEPDPFHQRVATFCPAYHGPRGTWTPQLRMLLLLSRWHWATRWWSGK